MRVLFFGTSPFALPTLQALHDAAPSHTVLGVVTQPDRPSGRGMKSHASPIKELALALGYPIFQPEKVRRAPFPDEVNALAPDALVVISFGQIIPKKMLDAPRYGGINVHASLLPRWRGAAPIHRALMAGDAETGVATMQMEPTLDTGPTFLVAREAIRPDDTTATLEARLAALGGPLLIQTLDALEAGTITAETQSEAGMTYATPIERIDGLLDPAIQTAVQMERIVRGMPTRPGALLNIDGRTVRVIEASVLEETPSAIPPGTTIVRKNGIAITSADASATLLVTRLQPENKGPMAAADWARGARLTLESRATIPTE